MEALAQVVAQAQSKSKVERPASALASRPPSAPSPPPSPRAGGAAGSGPRGGGEEEGKPRGDGGGAGGRGRAGWVPRHVGEAVAVSCPLLCGGFSRRSMLRRKCFALLASPSAQALLLACNLAGVGVVAARLQLKPAPDAPPPPPSIAEAALAYTDAALIAVLALGAPPPAPFTRNRTCLPARPPICLPARPLVLSGHAASLTPY